jgi:TonB family protein
MYARTAVPTFLAPLALVILLLAASPLAAQGSNHSHDAQWRSVTVTLLEAAEGTIAPQLLATNRLSRESIDRYPGWIEWNGQRRAEFLLHVSPQGRVTEARVETSSGNRLVDRALRDAALGLRFEPARSGEAAVAAWVRVPMVVEGN